MAGSRIPHVNVRTFEHLLFYCCYSALSQGWSLAVLAFGVLTTLFWMLMHHRKFRLQSFTAVGAEVEMTDFNSKFGDPHC
jgi:uncharacterized membrane protein